MSIFEIAAAAGAAIIQAADKVIDFFKSLTKTNTTPALPPPAPVKPCPNQNKDDKQDPKLHWIEFKIQDDKGNAMADVVVKLKLPNGSIETKTSDASGLIRMNNIEPGSCELLSNWKEHQVKDTVFIK